MRLLPLVLYSLSLAALFLVVGSPIDGEHYARQALVQSQIERTLAGGDWFRPGTYNFLTPPVMYETPIFQWVVSGIGSLGSAEPLVVSRCVSIASFLVALLAFQSILSRTTPSELERFFALAFAASSPLLLHYGSVPHSDGLAIACSLVAFAAFLRLDLSPEAPRRALTLAVLIASAFVAALIKCTIFVPIACAAVCHVVARVQAKQAASALPGLSFAGACALGSLSYVALREIVNGSTATPNESAAWLFGSLEARLDPAAWSSIGRSFGSLILAFPASFAAAMGLCLCVGRRPSRALYLGWAAGSAIYVLVFHNLHLLHSYYQMPIVFPAAYFAGVAMGWLWRETRRRGGAVRLAGIAALAAFSVFALSHGWRTLLGLRQSHAEESRRCGQWIRERTSDRDFVIYLTQADLESNEHLLYACGRDGHHLGIALLEQGGALSVLAIAQVHVLREGAPPRYERLHLFAPRALAPRAEKNLAGFSELEVERNAELGDLYSLDF